MTSLILTKLGRELKIPTGTLYLKMMILNVSWINWKNKFYEIMYECIPQTTSTAGTTYHPWLNKKLVNGMRRRNVLFKRAKQLRTSASWLKYKTQRNKLVSNLRRVKKAYMEKLCNLSSNAKKFWSAMKKLNNSPSSIPTLLHNNYTASSDKEKASMLTSFSLVVSINPNPHLIPQILTRCVYILTYALLSFCALWKRSWNCCKPWTLIRHQDQMV